MGSPTAYANGFTMEGRVQIKVEIAANGDTVLYGKRAADEEYVQLTDLLAGHMKEETVKGYVAMSFRGGAAPQYLYSVKVYNGKGSLLSKYDFTENLLESDELLLATNASKEVEAGNLVWEAPTAPVIPEPELLTGNPSFRRHGRNGSQSRADRRKRIGRLHADGNGDRSGWNRDHPGGLALFV